MASRPLTLTMAEDRLLADLPEGPVRSALSERGLPSRRAEAWKWSDLRAALKAPKDRSGPYTYTDDDTEPMLAALGGSELVLANGLLRSPAGLPPAIRVARCDPAPEVFSDMPVASLATAAPSTDVVIEESLGAPLFLRRLSEGAGAHADRVRVTVAAGARVTLIETHRMRGTPFVNSLTDLVLEDGAEVVRIVLQPGADDALLVATGRIRLAHGSQLEQMTLTGGAGLARHETRLDYAGTASARLDGLYDLSGTRHADVTSHVGHSVTGSVTRQLVKGIVRDRARGVFQGKFHVSREGQETDAQMAHHALVLSAEASVSAKPELEIYADDVECAHGNTSGALDADALFYLRQRGLSTTEAQSLLIDAFASEVFGLVRDEALSDALSAAFLGEAPDV